MGFHLCKFTIFSRSVPYMLVWLHVFAPGMRCVLYMDATYTSRVYTVNILGYIKNLCKKDIYKRYYYMPFDRVK